MWILILTAAAVCIVIIIVNILSFRKTSFAVESTGGVQARENASCSVRVKNDSILPIIYRRLLVLVENTYTGEVQKKHIRVHALAKSESEIRIGIALAHCGKIRCTVRGGVGKKKEAFCNFTILPELFSTRVEYNLHESDIYDCETYSPHRKGQDYSEIFQVREYVPGDNIKHIHWKLSGRSDDLMVKDASFPLDRSMMVIMDKGMSEGSCTPEQSEALASLTVSVCRSLSDEGMDYQLVWNDPAAEQCMSKAVQFESDLAEAIPHFLTGPVSNTDKSCAELYLQTVGNINSTHVIYISCGVQGKTLGVLADCNVTDLDARVKDYRSEYREILLY